MAAKKKKAQPVPDPVLEPILIIETPDPKPVSAPVPEPPKEAKGKHPCAKCNKLVEIYETVCSQTAKGYCSTNCYIAR